MHSQASDLTCPGCSSNSLSSLGPIPPAMVFAGRQLDTLMLGGNLYRCDRCKLGFRHPHLSKRQLDDLYRQGLENTWSTGERADRNDWNIAHQWIREHFSSGQVLDVGCFDGAFLARLGQKYEKFGVEIHSGAAKYAADKGVNLIASDLAELSSVGDVYDAVVSFDVIEHVENPREFLFQLGRLTSEQGMLIVSTGNLDSVTRWFMGSRYWYCAVPEHLSFISPKWFRAIAPDFGFRIVREFYFSHMNTSLRTKVGQLFKNLGYKVSPTFAGWLRSCGVAGKVPVSIHRELREMPPSWIAARDHFLVVLEKVQHL